MKQTTKKPAVDLFHIFEKELAALEGEASLHDEKKFPVDLKEYISKTEPRLVTIYESPLLNKLLPVDFLRGMSGLSVYRLPHKRPENFDYDEYRRKLMETDLAVVAADYLIAQSGTVVMLGTNHNSQLATLLPPTLVVLATTAQLVPDLSELHQQLQSSGQFRESSIKYITGPSKTADIEKTLILGVHGPKNVRVFVVEK
ncbi:MAG: lactate utilization protein C [Calditrichia bacterium]